MSDADWTQVAFSKLSSVLGAAKGAEAMRAVLESLGVERLESADDLYSFSKALIAHGGFAGAVGGLLSVHAIIHGARGTDAPPQP